jgi:ABC-type Co2+ transport system permease subunit
MHIPDGFIDVQTSAIFAGLAAAESQLRSKVLAPSLMKKLRLLPD